MQKIQWKIVNMEKVNGVWVRQGGDYFTKCIVREKSNNPCFV